MGWVNVGGEEVGEGGGCLTLVCVTCANCSSTAAIWNQ